MRTFEQNARWTETADAVFLPAEYAGKQVRKSWPALSVLAVWEVVGLLAEHRVLSWLNDFLDAHSGLVLTLTNSINATHFLLGCAFLIIAFRTFREGQRRRDAGHSPSGHHEIAPAPVTTIKQEASPVITASPTSTQNPSITNSNNFYLSGHPPPMAPVEGRDADVEQPEHNVSFAGVSKCRSNGEEDFIKKDHGNLAIKACFINPPRAGKPVEDAHGVRVRAVFRNEAGEEVAEVPRAKWLRHGTDDGVRIPVNARECLLLAMWYPAIGWHAPFLVQGSVPYVDDERDYSIEHHSLPNERLTVEITAVDGNGVGLNPVSVQIRFSAGGDAVIYAGTGTPVDDGGRRPDPYVGLFSPLHFNWRRTSVIS